MEFTRTHRNRNNFIYTKSCIIDLDLAKDLDVGLSHVHKSKKLVI